MRVDRMIVAFLFIACNRTPTDQPNPAEETSGPAAAEPGAVGPAQGGPVVDDSAPPAERAEGEAVEEARAAFLACNIVGASFGSESEAGEIEDVAWAHGHLYVLDDRNPNLSRYALDTSESSCTLTLDTNFASAGWLDTRLGDHLAVLDDRLLGSGTTTMVWLLDEEGTFVRCGPVERGRITVGADGVPLSVGFHETVLRLDVDNECALLPVSLPEGIASVQFATTTAFGLALVDATPNSRGFPAHVLKAVAPDGSSILWEVGTLEEGPEHLSQVRHLMAIDGGVAFVANANRHLVALNAQGEPTRRIDLTALDGSLPLSSGMASGPDDRVFVAVSMRPVIHEIEKFDHVLLSRSPL